MKSRKENAARQLDWNEIQSAVFPVKVYLGGESAFAVDYFLVNHGITNRSKLIRTALCYLAREVATGKVVINHPTAPASEVPWD